jgi:hypothetical protein
MTYDIPQPCGLPEIGLFGSNAIKGRDRGTARAILGEGFAVSAFVLYMPVQPFPQLTFSHAPRVISRVRLATMTVPVRSSQSRGRSLKYTPGAKGLPCSSTAVYHPIYAGTESGMTDTSTTRHDRERPRTLEVFTS